MKHTIITIGRQFGSHGRSIAKQLAKKLEYTYYDKELLVKASQESGLATSFLESMDERQASPFFYSLLSGPTQFMWNDQFISTEAMAYQAQHDTILKVAQEGNCVIVGRCADYILKDQERLVRVFISADLNCFFFVVVFVSGFSDQVGIGVGIIRIIFGFLNKKAFSFLQKIAFQSAYVFQKVQQKQEIH